jgi:hypothetical protein
MYALASLSNPKARVLELKAIQATVANLGASLAKVAASDNWLNDSLYRLATVEATQAKLQKVTIKFTRLKYDASDAGISSTTSEGGTGTFTVRRLDTFFVELGAGIITARLTAPKYGTEERDGQTFAVATSDEESSWAPAVVGNFVCRCWRSQILAPMGQFGALASANTPAILIGGGFRVWGGSKGGFGITFGRALAWVKRISEDELAKPINGTAEIEKRRRHVFDPANYVMFQYQF